MEPRCIQPRIFCMSSGNEEFTVLLSDLTVRLAGRTFLSVPSLSLGAGELVQVTGENGAGKTTLLRVIGGSLPVKGQVAVCGDLANSVQARKNLMMVPTEAVLPDDLTVHEYLTFCAASWSRPLAPVLTLAEAFKLGGVLDAWPSTLSRGTRQKVALSAALGLHLPVTLLDEPFSTLDAHSRQELLAALQTRVLAGGTVVVTTHGDELCDLPRRLIQVHDGEVTPLSAAVVA